MKSDIVRALSGWNRRVSSERCRVSLDGGYQLNSALGNGCSYRRCSVSRQSTRFEFSDVKQGSVLKTETNGG
jgi:hypothetical protein